jgi:hypothetical protein
MRPPAVSPLGGLMCVRRQTEMSFVALGLLLAVVVPVGKLSAQMIRGTVRAEGTEHVLQGASITVLDSLDRQVVAVISDAMGHFTLPLSGGRAFKVTVKKIGWQPSSTDLIHASVSDTLDMDLMVPMNGVVLPGVEIDAAKAATRNQLSYDEAKRNGWKVYEPSEIAARRDQGEFSEFESLMRSLSVTGVRMPASRNDCYVNLRNGKCMTFVVDGQPVGTMWVVNPVDVYFIAILQATQSSVQFGDKAPWGAILIVTRMNGDKKNP